jgi:hypothetical protein
LLGLESQGADRFFGEPAFEIHDFLHVDESGRGMVNVLAADKLMQSPKLYATFLLWLLSELFEALPEVGDPEKPCLVFFFDEAHLLFDDAPDALMDKVEQVVRLVRSKGVGVYFVTQNPIDIPEKVAGQLGNRVQHALRAFTPRDQKAIKRSGRDVPHQPRSRRGAGDHRAESGRSAGLHARCRRRAGHGRPHPDRPAPLAPGAGEPGRTRRDPGGQPVWRQIRYRRQPRERRRSPGAKGRRCRRRRADRAGTGRGSPARATAPVPTLWGRAARRQWAQWPLQPAR